MAAIAIVKPNSSSSLFTSANDQSAPTTMRLVSWLTLQRYHLPLTAIIPEILSLMDCVKKCGDNDKLNETDIFMSTLYGETKVRFEILLDQCNEALQINEKNDERILN
jgi:hypothetical protein